MSDIGEGTGEAATVDPAILAEARSMGWVDNKDKFNGKGQWIGAEEFVKTNRTRLPLLNARIDRLVKESKEKDEKLSLALKDIEAVADRSYKMAQAEYEGRISELEAAKAAAITDGDGKAAIAADKAIAALAKEAPEPPKKSASPTSEAEVPQEIKQWLDDNPWYSDGSEAQLVAQTAVASIAHRAKVAGTPMSPIQLANATRDYMAKYHPELIGVSNVSGHEEGRRSGTQSGGKGKRTFDNLPADDKAIVLRQIERGIWGKDPKTNKQTPQSIADFKDKYVKIYEWDD